ncbi:MAG: 2-C-methyl-D-erythritol 4-phosphate cytidylyltransferase [Verrucomicrobiota bacterium]
MRISAIIVAAGSSRRMGFDKLAADLAGEPVLNRSILAFQSCPEVAEIRVVTSAEKIDPVTKDAMRLGVTKFVEAVEGGAERYLSVNAGLSRVREGMDLVAVHDGARPLVSPEAITQCAKVAMETGAASLAHRVADTLKRADENQDVSGAVSREDLWAMETPQIFGVELLRRAYAEVLAKSELVTDEVSAIEALGEKVRLVENREPNLKITVPGDLGVAEAVMRG